MTTRHEPPRSTPHAQKRSFGALTLFLIISMWVTWVACDNPDPQGVFDSFVDQRNSNNSGNTTVTPTSGQRIDFSGTYLMGLQAPIPGSTPLMFQVEVTVKNDNEAIDLILQPIATDKLNDGSDRDNARQAVGEPITANDIPFKEDGTFEVDLGAVNADGAANPLSGTDITAEIVLNGLVGEGVFCGSATGQVTAPSQLSLDGATFSATLVEDASAIATTELRAVCPEDIGGGGDSDAGDTGGDDTGDAGDPDTGDVGPTEPSGRCPEGLEGEYDFWFETASSTEPTNLTLTLTASEEEGVCYDGNVVSNTDETELGQVSSVFEADNTLTINISDFIIPPGANPLLPNGGKANIELRGSNWTPNGSCGDLTFALFDPFALDNEGTFSMVRSENADGITTDGPTCESIVRAEACSLAGYEDAWQLVFKTDASAEPTTVTLNLLSDPLACIRGTMNSITDPDVVLANVQWTVPGEADAPVTMNLRNFIIPPGANPLLPNGGTADITLAGTESTENTFCGAITVALFEPFALDSGGTFATGRNPDNAPTTPDCPQP